MVNKYGVYALRLQLLKALAFIGERDKTAEGKVVKLTAQGKCGRLLIHTDRGESCVWRIGIRMVQELIAWFSPAVAA